jgi:hypothetical protein
MWDNNSKVVNIIASENLLLAKTLSGLISQQDYLFKIRAQNIYGYGEFSNVATIRTSDVPDTMSPVVSIT